MSLNPPFLSLPILPASKNFTKTILTKIHSSATNNYDYDNTNDDKQKMAVEEIRVCANRTCRRQGSLDVLQILTGISPPSVTVNSCGCLGRCGAGPNVVVLPLGVFVAHCGTASKAAHLMLSLICSSSDEGDEEEFERKIRECLEALALRKRAEDEMEKGNFDEALLLLSQAIDLKPFGGVHISYKSRSSARLAVGNASEALQDANKALSLAPKYSEAYTCQGDAFMAMGQFDAAEKSYAMALELKPSLRRSKSFKDRITVLQEKLTPANSA